MADLKLFVVDVSYRYPKKRPGFDCTDWKPKRLTGFVVRAADHESAALFVARWLVECKSESVRKYPRTVEIDVTQHDDDAKPGIAWSTNGDGATTFTVEDETGEIEVCEKPL